MHQCQGCEHQTDLVLCGGCVNRLSQTLVQAICLAQVMIDEELRITKKAGERVGSRPSGPKPLPFNDEAPKAYLRLQVAIDKAAIALLDEHEELVLPASWRTSALSRWLYDHGLWLADVDGVYVPVTDAVEAAEKVIHPPLPPSVPEDVAKAREVYVTAAEAQRWLGEVDGVSVKASRLRQWARRGLINRIGEHYRVGDILDRLSPPT